MSTPIPPSNITSQEVYQERRRWLELAVVGLGGSLLTRTQPALAQRAPLSPLPPWRPSSYGRGESLTSMEDITHYNNFYEFGTDKTDPAQQAGTLRTRPWTITLEGAIKHPLTLDIDELIRKFTLEERIYRMRCVEAWSMVIPWLGFPLGTLIRWAEPTGNARFVEFESLSDPEQMPGVRSPVLDWPYREGLRLDEALHPLTMLAVGLYGKVLPPQNGAPLRLVVPWKYGFKSIKSIVRIRLVEQMPLTSWMRVNSHEYGFYSNVNPEVDHPRWSQATERRIGASWFAPRQKTLPFNGYAEEVASLYQGMNLRQNF